MCVEWCVKSTTFILKRLKMTNNKYLLTIENHGCNLEFEKIENHYLVSILNYEGFSVVEVTKEHLQEIKNWIIENEN